MNTNIFKQTLASVRQQPVLSIVAVTGTALAIFLIMVVVMMQQVMVAPFSPESNRDRLLHAQYGSIKALNESDGWSSNGPISEKSAKALYKSLDTPEAVTIHQAFLETSSAVIPGGTPVEVDLSKTDDDFWKVFDFRFIHGKPYDKAAFDAGLKQAVITRSVARAVFGTEDVVGREFKLDYTAYSVAGVVEDVSTLASAAYAQVWIPYTSSPVETWNSGLMGSMRATLLAKSRDDFDAIKKEVEHNYAKYNEEIVPTGWKFVPFGRPYDQETASICFDASSEPDVTISRRKRFVVYLILLIVPAINLSSMTDSRMRQRVSEIGVRRAFGCLRSEIALQIISESLIITLFAGALGWLMSVVFAYLCGSMLFTQPFSATLNPPSVDVSMLIQGSTFLWALLFCFILNLLSSGIPSWRASRTKIVTALNGNKH
ncbi:MAG TPA: ABC transporter permease [Muribaculum sp.]|jgi:putative ABC transport system permease protein|uniref:ABC transporter permease n=1 Tax=Heminiphilus faecis TaxID=2601703 RepID=A0ABV4CVV8_9BACT|nr:ABC transporter permease [Heminiphilus faecis]RLT75985.1 ABC transporter permease [bacterium J10(2018)]HRF69601.1 ABC transporter permease [Muribaculum sp.]